MSLKVTVPHATVCVDDISREIGRQQNGERAGRVDIWVERYSQLLRLAVKICGPNLYGRHICFAWLPVIYED